MTTVNKLTNLRRCDSRVLYSSVQKSLWLNLTGDQILRPSPCAPTRPPHGDPSQASGEPSRSYGNRSSESATNNQPTNLLTAVGARDAYASKKITAKLF